MSAIAFDTLQFAKRLRTLGMTDSHAELFAEAQKEAITSAVETVLATKTDLEALELRLTSLLCAVTVRLNGTSHVKRKTTPTLYRTGYIGGHRHRHRPMAKDIPGLPICILPAQDGANRYT